MAAIGVNALYLIPGEVGGTEIYLRNLLRALAEIDTANEYFVFTNRETGGDLVPDQRNFHAVPQPVRATSRPTRILWEQIRLPAVVRRHGLDVLLNPGYTSPMICSCPTVTVFHDLQHRRHPEYFGAVELASLRLLLWGSAHRSRSVIAVSESTRADFLSCYGVAADKVRAIHLGVDPDLRKSDRSSPEPFVLCVSTLRVHKNLDRLLRAFKASRLERRLVIAGPAGSYHREIMALIGELGLGDSVELTGWIPREQLLSLYQRAHALIQPSLFEGFGLPVLEGLAAGVPVACSDIPPMREIGGDAALYFDPLDEHAIASALERICNDRQLRLDLPAIGLERARQFTWRRTAQATLAALTS